MLHFMCFIILYLASINAEIFLSQAIELYGAERIGHGYHVLEDEALYATVRSRGIHLENCPWSSYLTGSVPLSTAKHPVVQ